MDAEIENFDRFLSGDNLQHDGMGIKVEIEKARALHEIARVLGVIAIALENIEGNLRAPNHPPSR